MDIKTKFSLNEKVYRIQNQREKRQVICKVCNGDMRIKAGGKDFSCPECYGRGFHWKYTPNRWVCVEPDRIGSIRIEINNIEPNGDFDNIGHYKEGNTKYKYEYMLYGTGIGSGTLWKQDKLFSTRKKAEDKCAMLNAAEDEDKQ